MVLSVSLVLVALLFLSAAYYRAARKGFTTTLSYALLTLPFLLGVAAPLVALYYADHNAIANNDYGRMFLIFIGWVVLWLSGAVTSWLVACQLPNWSHRRAGRRPRKHRYYLWGVVLTVFSIYFSVSRFTRGEIIEGLQLVYWLILGWALVAWLEQRVRSKDLVEKLGEDSRLPILYLREFGNDNQPVTRIPKAHSTVQQDLQNRWVTLEGYLANEVDKRLGPLVALGDPLDTLAPLGAARAYVKDEEWEKVFVSVSELAQAVIMEPGATDSLQWELESILARSMHRKFFVVTLPQGKGTALFSGWLRLSQMLQGRKGARWSDFCSRLDAAGFNVCEDPGPGAVVGFDQQRNPLVLLSRGRTPTEFVETIGAALPKADAASAVVAG
jgi:hypothetical protein